MASLIFNCSICYSDNALDFAHVNRKLAGKCSNQHNLALLLHVHVLCYIQNVKFRIDALQGGGGC